MTMPTDYQLKGIRHELAFRYGDEIAQFTLLRLCEAHAAGREITAPFTWCMVTGSYRQSYTRKHEKRFVSFDAWTQRPQEVGLNPDDLVEYNTPETIYEEKEREALAAPVLRLQADIGRSMTGAERVAKHRAQKKAMAKVQRAAQNS